jgi:opacity protein-like surface antigen
MKRMSVLIVTFAGIAALAAAQDKVTVPLSSPGQPATIKARMVMGSITVTAGTGPQVVIESDEAGRDRGSRREDRNVPPGMHRIDAGGHGFNVEEDHNVVTVVPDFNGRGTNLTIQVPVNTSVELKTVNGGHIDVTGISGDLNVDNVNGSVTLKNVSGSVSASTVNGSLTVAMDRVTPDKPMSFSSLNGKVDVTLPADAKARLRIKTTNGAVYSDFDVKMEPDTSKPVIEDGRGQGGKYRIRMDRGVYGSINGGGPEYSFQTMNGSILIHKK